MSGRAGAFFLFTHRPKKTARATVFVPRLARVRRQPRQCAGRTPAQRGRRPATGGHGGTAPRSCWSSTGAGHGRPRGAVGFAPRARTVAAVRPRARGVFFAPRPTGNRSEGYRSGSDRVGFAGGPGFLPRPPPAATTEAAGGRGRQAGGAWSQGRCRVSAPAAVSRECRAGRPRRAARRQRPPREGP
jgi:hypothetical protein